MEFSEEHRWEWLHWRRLAVRVGEGIAPVASKNTGRPAHQAFCSPDLALPSRTKIGGDNEMQDRTSPLIPGVEAFERSSLTTAGDGVRSPVRPVCTRLESPSTLLT